MIERAYACTVREVEIVPYQLCVSIYLCDMSRFTQHHGLAGRLALFRYLNIDVVLMVR